MVSFSYDPVGAPMSACTTDHATGGRPDVDGAAEDEAEPSAEQPAIRKQHAAIASARPALLLRTGSPSASEPEEYPRTAADPQADRH